MVAARLGTVLSLALLVSHCVDIDDRKLKEHDGNGDDDSGGSSNGGTGTGGSSRGGSSNGGSSSGAGGSAGLPEECQPMENDSDCVACYVPACCDEYLSCLESDDCVGYVSCVNLCEAGDTLCVLDCADVYPEGEGLFADLLECTDDRCTSVCS